MGAHPNPDGVNRRIPLSERLSGDMNPLLDPFWVEHIIAQTHREVQAIRKRQGLPEWDFEHEKQRTDAKRARSVEHRRRALRIAFASPAARAYRWRQNARKNLVPCPAEICSRLREWRLTLRLSCYAAGRRIGISDQLVKRIELELQPYVRKETMTKLLRLLGDAETGRAL